jgi:hypothetical protein
MNKVAKTISLTIVLVASLLAGTTHHTTPAATTAYVTPCYIGHPAPTHRCYVN